MMLKYLLYFFLPMLFLLTGCDRSKEIYVPLPEYEPQLVVECYLVPGEPIRMSVLESVSYFGDPQPPLVPDAEAYITYKDKRIKLTYRPTVIQHTNKFYTHNSPEIITGKPGDVYGLEVTDGKGRKVTGFTTLLPPVPIDTIEWRFNDKDKALLLTYFQDDPEPENNYRYMVHRDSLTRGPEQDILLQDNLNNGKLTTLGSLYDYEKGDTLIVSLYHIERQYYNFITSTSDARSANGNPFAQPSRIKSSVTGGIGIFTNLAFDRKTVIIK